MNSGETRRTRYALRRELRGVGNQWLLYRNSPSTWRLSPEFAACAGEARAGLEKLRRFVDG